MANIGYARVSTDAQELQLQLDALTAAGCVRIFEEKVSSRKDDRPELVKALDYARAGDTIVVYKLSRLARSPLQSLTILQQLNLAGIEFRSLTEPFDTTTAHGRLLFTMVAAFAELERDQISENTKAGLAAARANGKTLGRPRTVTPAKARMIRMLKDEGSTHQQIAGEVGVSVASVKRALSGAL